MARIPSVFRLLLLTAVFAGLLAGRGPSSVSAGGIEVNTTTDAVDANPGADGCMTAALTCSLRAAIQEANASSGSDSINVPAGTYVLSVADGDGSVDLDVTSAVTVTGAGTPSTIIDAADVGRAFDIAQTGFVGISNVTIRNGDVTSGGLADGNGGGVRVTGGQVLLSNVAVMDNAAPGGGGGVFNADGSLTIANSTISGNASADPGGGITSDGGSTSLTNVTISGNTSMGGAAIAVMNGELSMNNTTIAQNTSSFGSLRAESGSITFSNTIIGPNSAGNCVAAAGGSFVSTGHNLSNDATCSLNAAGDLPNTDAMLAPLADNGGSTLTHALQALSLAIDAGDDILCNDTDQRGIDRPQGAHCDIGAFEVEVPIAQGDVDCSQGIDAVDALKVLRFAASLSVVQTEPCPEPPSLVGGFPFGDVDCNNFVNAVDGLKILRHNAALSVAQTEPCTDIGQEL